MIRFQPESMATVPDKNRLTILLGRYGRDKFYQQNKYELMDSATSPEKRVANTPMCAIEQTGEFESWDDSKVAAWVDSILTRYAQPSLLFDLLLNRHPHSDTFAPAKRGGIFSGY